MQNISVDKLGYFLNIAKTVSTASKCTRRKVGAVIVDSQNRIISTGYNGSPIKTDDFLFPLEIDNKTQPYVIHAELNAILFAKQDLTDTTLFVTMSPCLHCAALIIQSGIKTVVYSELYRDISGIQFLISNGILVIQYEIS